jgi:hypothetical protein
MEKTYTHWKTKRAANVRNDALKKNAKSTQTFKIEQTQQNSKSRGCCLESVVKKQPTK